ncbi:hypothetical protein F3Y22_tig00002799pilonHSYRG00010 [Hibiscus syriacus]|uniref:Uncharacterized protein n=1 Tax=Hibiscus syriacus TaxID=106335 RepID=A0A6A3CSH2_HIBSY|nr:hypothetical protein F3Y22_tig00002799pilonHSYRG00010 [Hibiscus syriacus]
MLHVDSDNNSSDYEAIFQDDFTDIDSSSDIEEIMNSDSDEENLTDFICADQMAKATDALLMVEDQITQRTLPEDAIGSPYFYYEQIHLSNPMIGSVVPTKSDQITQRTLPEDAIGSPYLYYKQTHLSNPMIWNKVVPLEPDEVEMHLVFPKNHTRGGGSTRDMFPSGINVLSLFSKINDAEVAFYCLGIPLKTDVQELNSDQLEQLMSRFGGFDLVVDGIQRNNLTGRNKHHQDEIEDFFGCIFLQ